jgi:hypothetical protein
MNDVLTQLSPEILNKHFLPHLYTRTYVTSTVTESTSVWYVFERSKLRLSLTEEKVNPHFFCVIEILWEGKRKMQIRELFLLPRLETGN